MVKKIVFTVMLFLLGMSVFSQTKGVWELGFGIGSSMSSANILINDHEVDSKSGFNTYLSGEYYFSDRWGLKSKLIYDQKGFKNKKHRVNASDGLGYSIKEVEFPIDYLTIPVMINWHFSKRRNWYLNFGPFVGVVLKAESEVVNDDFEDYVKDLDVGLAFGIGYKYRINELLKAFVELDLQYSFSDVLATVDGASNKRSSINIGVLYSLN